jgi:hypothetical protein
MVALRLVDARMRSTWPPIYFIVYVLDTRAICGYAALNGPKSTLFSVLYAVCCVLRLLYVQMVDEACPGGDGWKCVACIINGVNTQDNLADG